MRPRNLKIQEEGDILLKAFYRGDLDNDKALIIALSNKWFRLNTLYMIKPKFDEDEEELARERPALVPFVPNWAQRHFWGNKHNRNVILKARQLGFTTLKMIDETDSVLFSEKVNSGVIAHTKNDATAIFDDKVKVAYENIPEHWLDIMDALHIDFPTPVKDRAGGYEFSNGSRIDVSTSYRGGTLKSLHVSEYGKICKKHPINAKEIKTGAFEAVPLKGEITIESTAEGQEGEFYRICQSAEKRAIAGDHLTKLDFKFFFYPWYECPDYRMDSTDIAFAANDLEYFEKLEQDCKTQLSRAQRVWYIKKRESQGEDMKQEYPSTPAEAFEAAIEGAYYASIFAKLRKAVPAHILSIPYDNRLPVYTFWDLGRNDSTAIWFMQHVWGEYRFIDYLENSGESIQYYCRELRKKEYNYGTMYFPHDGDVTDLSSGDNLSRKQIVESMGFRVEIVPRVPDKLEAIQAVRDILPQCWFDKDMCAEGIKALESFRKEWDDKRGVWKDRPLHDWASHGASAFEQFARGFSVVEQNDSYEPDEVY